MSHQLPSIYCSTRSSNIYSQAPVVIGQRLTCRRLYEMVSNPSSWCVASFDHDHFTNSKVLDTILKLCAPGTKRLDVNTQGLMPRFPWVRFLKHLTRISSNLSHFSLVGVEVSTKQLDMLLNACSVVTHLKVVKKEILFSKAWWWSFNTRMF